MKQDVLKSPKIEAVEKSRLRIAIERLMIDLNEEIFGLSEELSKSFSEDRARSLHNKLKDF